MKPFVLIFIPLYLLILGAGVWGLVHSMPIPGSGTLPDSLIREQELAGRLSEVVMFPARWSGEAAPFLGPAVWALVPSIVFARRWRRGASLSAPA
jgi:hypothetical protein